MVKNKNRILIVAHSFIERSGVEVYIHNLVNWMARLEPNYKFILVVNNRSREYFPSELENVIVVNPSLLLNNQIGKILWYIFFVRKFIKKNNISLVFNCSAGNTFLILKNIPIISVILDLAEFHVKNKYSPSRMFYRKYICLPINKYFTNKFISISQSTKDDFIRYYRVAENKVSVIYPGADHFKDDKEIINMNNRDKYLLYVGRLDPYGKNVLNLILAFNKVLSFDHNIKLHLVGNKSRRSDIVYKKISELNLNDKVIIHGYVNDDDLKKLYQGATLFLFPSFYEGFGFPILEAMMYGVPVLCSNTSSLPEIAGDSAMYFNPSNVDDIADKIMDVLNNKELQKSLSFKGREQYKKYTWHNSAKLTLNEIKHFLG